MATYTELFDLRNDNELLNKMQVAVTKKAQQLLDGGAPTADEVSWADSALRNTQEMSVRLYRYVLAANSSATVSAIQGASDAAIQSNVDAASDAMIAGGITS